MGMLSIETLMKLDRKQVMEVPVKEVHAKHLSKILGHDVNVKIKALSGNTYTELLAGANGKKGNVNISKIYKAQTLIVVEAMQEPSLKDKELQNHFGVGSPADLAQILFPRGEMVTIFNAVSELSGYGDDDEDEDTDDEVKNS